MNESMDEIYLHQLVSIEYNSIYYYFSTAAQVFGGIAGVVATIGVFWHQFITSALRGKARDVCRMFSRQHSSLGEGFKKILNSKKDLIDSNQDLTSLMEESKATLASMNTAFDNYEDLKYLIEELKKILNNDNYLINKDNKNHASLVEELRQILNSDNFYKNLTSDYDRIKCIKNRFCVLKSFEVIVKMKKFDPDFPNDVKNVRLFQYELAEEIDAFNLLHSIHDRILELIDVFVILLIFTMANLACVYLLPEILCKKNTCTIERYILLIFWSIYTVLILYLFIKICSLFKFAIQQK